MDEKRFVKEKSMPNKFISCIRDNGKYLSYGELENTLNALHEEITKLNETIKTMDQTKHTTNKEAIIKRIIKCYLTFEKEATANTILRHIENTGYGLNGLKGSAYFTKMLKKWKHDDRYLNNLKWYVNNRNITVFYLDKKRRGLVKMTEHCFDCKYCNVVNGMQSCAGHSGLSSSYSKCERYEKDWSHTIGVVFCFISIFILPIILIVYLILIGLGVL